MTRNIWLVIWLCLTFTASAARADERVIQESKLKETLRSLHEIDRRLKGVIADLRHEVSRYQIVTVSPLQSDHFIMDPWFSENPGLEPMLVRQDMYKKGPYLPPRPEFVGPSVAQGKTLVSQAISANSDAVQALATLGISGAAKSKIMVMSDSLGTLVKELQDFEMAASPASFKPGDNQSLDKKLEAMSDVVDGFDRMAKEEWSLAEKR